MTIQESSGATVPGRARMHLDPFTGVASPISATARTPQSLKTAIRADRGESDAYKEALRRGEIGLQRPMGANVRGVDFITATTDGSEILVTDVKTSEAGKFPLPKTTIPGDWLSEVWQAVERLTLNDRALVARIKDAHQRQRVRLRQLNVNYSPQGQGLITGW
jgi:hypothetical protein